MRKTIWLVGTRVANQMQSRFWCWEGQGFVYDSFRHVSILCTTKNSFCTMWKMLNIPFRWPCGLVYENSVVHESPCLPNFSLCVPNQIILISCSKLATPNHNQWWHWIGGWFCDHRMVFRNFRMLQCWTPYIMHLRPLTVANNTRTRECVTSV